MIDRRIRVRLPSERELVSAGLRAMLAAHRDRIEVVDAADPDETDVEIVDVTGTGTNGSSALAVLGREPGRRMVALVDAEPSRRLVDRALDRGAAGVVRSSDPAGVLADALVAVAGGQVVVSPGVTPGEAAAARWPGEERGLSRRESQVLVLIAGGRSPEDITRVLGVAHETVRSHLKRLYHKLGVRDRASAVATAWIDGIVDRLTVTVEGPPSRESADR